MQRVILEDIMSLVSIDGYRITFTRGTHDEGVV